MNIETLLGCIDELSALKGQPASFHKIDFIAHRIYELGKKEGGRPTGKIVLVNALGKILLELRKKKSGIRFCLPGGGIDYGILLESLLTALQRELEEELELKNGFIHWETALFLGPARVRTNREQWCEKVMLVTTCTCSTDLVLIPKNGGDGPPDEVCWVDFSEAKDLFGRYPQRPDRKEYLLWAIRTALDIRKPRLVPLSGAA